MSVNGFRLFCLSATLGLLGLIGPTWAMAGSTGPAVVSFNVLYGTQSFNVTTSTRKRLPWAVSGIQVVFSESIMTADVSSLGGVTAASLSGLGTNTLTWTLSSPLELGSFGTTLAGSGANAIKDAEGNALSGGGGFSQTLNVLWGDLNDDGVVNSADLTLDNNARALPYNIFADMNGDGVVNPTDVTIVRSRLGTSLCQIEVVPGGSNLTNPVPSTGTPISVSGSFMVSAGAACTTSNPWVATSNSSWLIVTSGPTGNASSAASVTYLALSNATTSSRTATITVTPTTLSPVSFSASQPGSTAPLLDREVTALYQSILGRDPDSGGYAFWTAGSSGLGETADAFFTSPESFNTNFAVIAAYQAATGAPPTYAEFTPAVLSVRLGGQTIAGLFSSLVVGNSSYSATNLYQNLLNRAPGSAEDAACISAGLSTCFETVIGYPQTVSPIGTTANEWQSTCGVGACIGVGSTTHLSTGDHTNALYIYMLYFTLLNVNPDPGGLQFWVGVANSGGAGILFQGTEGSPTRIQILGPGTPSQGFIGSPEFQSRFQ